MDGITRTRILRAAAASAAVSLFAAGVTGCGLRLPEGKKDKVAPAANPSAPQAPKAPPFDATPGYVALGDSFASGLKIPPVADGSPPGCGRSTKNYAHLIAARKGVTLFTDATCSGAKTGDLSAGQRTSGSPPPQLDALRPDTALVTLGIGGNDIGFGNIVETCATKAISVTSIKPCTDFFNDSGIDVLAERIAIAAPKVAESLAAIKQRSPRAKVIVVGYPAILPDDTMGCVTQAPFHPGDLPYLRDVTARLNGMLRDAALNAGATYADVQAPSKGHDVCAPADTRWVEGVRPSAKDAAPMHPTSLGHEATANLILTQLG